MNIKELAKMHKWNLPSVCPVCGGDLELNDNHKMLKCINDFCPSKFAGRIDKWTNSLDIKEFGLRTIETLFEAGIIKTISSLYTMDLKKIAALEGFGERSAAKMKKELDAHNKMTLAKFVAGYNIEGCGEKIIEKVIEAYKCKTLDDLLALKSCVCDGVGEIISNKLITGLKAMKTDMKKTLNFIKIKTPEKKTIVAGGLAGKSFCFTGAASRPRKELWSMVESNGGVVFEAVKKGLDFLVLADPNSTSSKAVKARSMGITLISEDDFVKMCNG